MKKISNIGVVIVTYNRLDKLKKTLNYYFEQTVLPKYIIVVNNASNDGTKEYLEEWEKESSIIKKYVIDVEDNIGGSGGFFIGEEKALTLDADWILVADDDAYPDKDYLKISEKFLSEHKNEKISAICGKVIQYGSYINPHRGFINIKFKIGMQNFCTEKYYMQEYFSIQCVSYVGLIMNVDILKKIGIVKKDFFIYYDDTEHGIRLNKAGKIYCIPKLKFEHDCALFNEDIVWKRYYGLRNQIYVIRKYFPLFLAINLLINIAKAFLCILKGRTFDEVKMRLIAIKDGILGNLGKHKKYKPGWKPENIFK